MKDVFFIGRTSKFFLLSITMLLFMGLINLLPKTTILNQPPKVVPSLREWTPGTRTFSLSGKSRILVDNNYADMLSETATTNKNRLKHWLQ